MDGTATLDRKGALEKAGRLLSVRPRTEHELRIKLTVFGAEADVIEATIARLHELRLIDDVAFARQWVEERRGRKSRSTAALIAELGSKGIDRATAEEALSWAERHEGPDDLTVATELASGRASRWSHLPVQEQGVKIYALLLRRGFEADIAKEATRAVLPPEGWD
ncbi:MAG TPA: regulatory protein RecX [Actinomycetota bacterium]|nr:regulatory protein RecX [Actinomycetota bacterium]